MWRLWLSDTMTGELQAPIDVPSFRWTLSVSDCSLSTTRDKGTGDGGATGLQLPWTAVPASTPEGRSRALASYRRSLVLAWERSDGTVVPLLVGAIGPRTDTWLDTSFDLISPVQFLGSRVLVREGSFGRGQYNADHTKGASGTAYGQQQSSWRAYVDWTRTEDEGSVTVNAVGGIECVGGKVDLDGVSVATTVGGETRETTTSIHYDASGGSRKFGVHRVGYTMARGDTRLSLKSQCACKVQDGTLKNGKPKYATSTATTTSQVVTADAYRERFRGINRNSHGGTTEGTIAMAHLSARAIAAEIGAMCTGAKPGGAMPVDWRYRGEAGWHSLSAKECDVGSNSLAALWRSISDADGGPDLQLRPYMPDATHVRLAFEAGSDADPTLGGGPVPTLTAFPGGGTLHDIKVAHLGPTQRVYATGAGQDEAQLGSLAEDLTLVRQGVDPWPLVEEVVGFSDDDDAGQLADHAQARLEAVSRPVLQLQGSVALGDPHGIEPGDVWPGQDVDVAVRGFPTLPDGTYRMRLMQVEGDQGDQATLTFDVCQDPIYS